MKCYKSAILDLRLCVGSSPLIQILKSFFFSTRIYIYIYIYILYIERERERQREDITRWREDMNLVFEWQNKILRTSAASE